MADPNIDLARLYLGGLQKPEAAEAEFQVWVNESGTSFQYIRNQGATSQRPVDPPVGFTYYDTTSGGSFFWTGSNWVAIEIGFEEENFGSPITFDRNAYITVSSGSGRLYLDRAASGHRDGITKTLLIQAGSGITSLQLSPNITLDQSLLPTFDPNSDYMIVMTYMDGYVITSAQIVESYSVAYDGFGAPTHYYLAADAPDSPVTVWPSVVGGIASGSTAPNKINTLWSGTKPMIRLSSTPMAVNFPDLVEPHVANPQRPFLVTMPWICHSVANGTTHIFSWGDSTTTLLIKGFYVAADRSIGFQQRNSAGGGLVSVGSAPAVFELNQPYILGLMYDGVNTIRAKLTGPGGTTTVLEKTDCEFPTGAHNFDRCQFGRLGGAASNDMSAGGIEVIDGEVPTEAILDAEMANWIASPLEYVPNVNDGGLSGVLGAPVDLLWHADDLGASGSTITTVTDRVGSGGVAEGNPTVSTSGWIGARKTASSDGSGDLINWAWAATPHNNAPDYPFTWLMGLNLPAGNTVRNIGGFSDGAGTDFKLLQAIASDVIYFSQNKPSTLQSFGTGKITEGAPMLLGISFTGTTIYIEKLTSSGSTVILNSVARAPGAGTIVQNAFTLLGYKYTGSSSVAGHARINVLQNGFAATPTAVSNALVHIRDNLHCPLA